MKHSNSKPDIEKFVSTLNNNKNQCCGETSNAFKKEFNKSGEWIYTIYTLSDTIKKYNTYTRELQLDTFDIEEDEFKLVNVKLVDILCEIKNALKNNFMVYMSLTCGDMFGHAFTLFEDADKYYIADSYAMDRPQCTIRPFDFKLFQSMVEDGMPYESWNSIFMCCETKGFACPGDLEIHIQYPMK